MTSTSTAPDRLGSTKQSAMRRTTAAKVEGSTGDGDIWSVPVDVGGPVKTYTRTQRIPPSPSSTGQNSSEEGPSSNTVMDESAKRRKLEDPYAFPIRERSGETSLGKGRDVAIAGLMPSPMSREADPTPTSQPATMASNSTIRPHGKAQVDRRTIRSPKPAAVTEAATSDGKGGRREISMPPNGQLSPTSPARLQREKSSTPVLSGRITKPRANSPKSRKPRLIDRLTAQAGPSSDEEGEPVASPKEILHRRRLQATPEPGPATPLLVSDAPGSRVTTIQMTVAKKSGPKFVYGMQRSMLAEPLAGIGGLAPTEEEAGAIGLPTAEDFSQPLIIEPAGLFDEGLEDDETENGAVQGIHELRQAGANTRFSDEMDDMFGRIRTPGDANPSLRRSGLLELAQKMPDSSFRRHFRDYIHDGRLFRQLDRETDTIAAFAIVAILVNFLSSSKAPHLVEQLQAQGIQGLLSRLLDMDSDVAAIAKDRKSNMSVNSRKTLAAVKAALLLLPVWTPMTPSELSPRTLALKCTELLAAQLPRTLSEHQLLSVQMVDKLFIVLANTSEVPTLGLDGHSRMLNVVLALRLLVNYSVIAAHMRPDWTWTKQHLSTIAGLVDFTLKQPTAQQDELTHLALRLVLDATNKSQGAEIMTRRIVPELLLQSVSATLDAVARPTLDDASRAISPDTLTLLLCILINFCEHYPPSIERLQDLGNTRSSPFEALFAFFFDYQSRTGEVSANHSNLPLSLLTGPRRTRSRKAK